MDANQSEVMRYLSFELFVACRYLFAHRKQAFISLISLISMSGVAVGVMALVIRNASTTEETAWGYCDARNSGGDSDKRTSR
jgi:hypothetical protein